MDLIEELAKPRCEHCHGTGRFRGIFSSDPDWPVCPHCSDMIKQTWRGMRKLGVPNDHALAEAAIRVVKHANHDMMLDALKLWAAYDDLLRTFEGPQTLVGGDFPAIDAAYDKCVAATRAALQVKDTFDA